MRRSKMADSSLPSETPGYGMPVRFGETAQVPARTQTSDTSGSAATSGARLVVPLEEIGRGDLALAGGKGANLGELVRADFPVPDGFVVTTAAYDRFVEDNRLDEVIARALQEEQGTGDSIRAAFEAAPIAAEVQDEIVM